MGRPLLSSRHHVSCCASGLRRRAVPDFPERQDDPEDGPVRPAFHPDLPPVVLHDAVGDGEPEAASPLLCGEEGGEDLFPVLRGDPRPRIADGDLHPPPGAMSRVARVSVPPRGMAWTAFTMRFVKTWRSWSASPLIVGMSAA